jgi:hypothetical protein
VASQDPKHSDNFARGNLATADPTAELARTPGRAVNNTVAAEAAERKREYTAGGDDGTATAPPALAAPARPSLVAAATARIRAPERPSPFGVAQFPPIPLPPGMAK